MIRPLPGEPPTGFNKILFSCDVFIFTSVRSGFTSTY